MIFTVSEAAFLPSAATRSGLPWRRLREDLRAALHGRDETPAHQRQWRGRVDRRLCDGGSPRPLEEYHVHHPADKPAARLPLAIVLRQILQ